MGRTRSLIWTALFTALTAAGAFLRIPTPVSSFSLQILFTAMAGILLGRRWGAVSQLVYVLLGLAGLPVFTAGGGFSSVAQPTFGFLLGMIPMAWIIGYLTERFGYGFGSLCAACAAGLGVLYLLGLPYLYLILTQVLEQPWTFGEVLQSGMLVFLPWDCVKLAAASALCAKLRPQLDRISVF